LAAETLSLAAARRIALAAQGFGAKPAADSRRAVARTFDRLGLIQIDSVNAVVRSHYLPVFSRHGGYDRSELDRYAQGKRRSVFEYWGHEASLVPGGDLSAAALAHGPGRTGRGRLQRTGAVRT
jgi:uncharacterized protein YcaQ